MINYPNNGTLENRITAYEDFSNEKPPADISCDEQSGISSEGNETKRRGPRGGVSVPFPLKLHRMLESIVNTPSLCNIVSWQPHGRCFVVHRPDDFVRNVMPFYFNQSKMTSFQRQLNLYGFTRMVCGNDRNGYYHPMFLRGREFLATRIMRTRVKGNRMKTQPNPKTEPHFYKMPFVYALPEDEDVDNDASVAPTTITSSSTSSGRELRKKQSLDMAVKISSDFASGKLSIPSSDELLNGTIDSSSSVTFDVFEGHNFHSTDPSRVERTIENDFVMTDLEPLPLEELHRRLSQTKLPLLLQDPDLLAILDDELFDPVPIKTGAETTTVSNAPSFDLFLQKMSPGSKTTHAISA